MRCSWMLLLVWVCITAALAKPANGQSWDWYYVSVSLEETKLIDIFEEIESKTDFVFLYGKDVIKHSKRYSLTHESVSVKTVLEDLADQVGMQLSLADFTITAKLLPREEESQLIIASEPLPIVTGTVKDAETDEPLVGASIRVKGMNIGVLSDDQGNFELNVPDEAGAIIVSYIGYVSQEIPVEDQTMLNISLKPNMSALAEVVVIGYGNEERRDLTTAVSSVGSEDIDDQPVAGFDEALIGKMAGVHIAATSGAPGNTGEIRIRGIGTLTAGIEPLIVLDGIPLSEGVGLSTINPADIESIDVLKDASAASIYGSRGANGVIIVTTKSGTYRGRPEMNFNAYGGIQEVSQTVELMDAYEMARYVAAGRNNAWVNLDPANHSASDPNAVRDDRYKIPDYMQPYLEGQPGLTNTDWQDELFRTAPIQNYQLSVRGGGESFKYYASGNYFNQEGIIQNTDFERFSLRLNMDAYLTDQIKMGISLNPSRSTSNLTNPGGHWQNGVVIGTFFAQPFFPVYNSDGSFELTQMLGSVIQDRAFLRAVQNPVAIANMEERLQTESRMIGRIYLDYELLEGLTFQTSWGLDFTDRRLEFFRPAALGFYNNLPPGISAGSLHENEITNWLTENTLTYQKRFGSDHHFTALAGYTFQKAEIDQSQIGANNFQDDRIRTLNAGNILPNETFSRAAEWSLISYIGRVSYDFRGKYLISTSVRRDGSSRFGDNSKWGVFPSVSAGWRISEEGFFNTSQINELKLRASWGLTGNNQIGNFASQSLLTATNYVIEGQLRNGLSPSTLPNESLSWETTEMLDIGLDAEFFEGKLFFTADYFQSTTTDLLLNVPVPASAGYTSSISNFGEVENTGWEFLLGSRVNLGSLSIRSSINLSTVMNEVVALGPDQDQIISGGVFITRVGEPISSYYGYRTIGVFTSAEQLESLPSQAGAKLGSYIFEDANGDGTINGDDRQIIGSPWPDYTFGISTELGFRGFDLSFNLQGVQGYDVYLNNAFTYYQHEAWTNVHRDLLQGVDDPMNSEYAWPNIDTGESLWQSSTQKFADASYVRLRNLTLGYTFPDDMLSVLGIDKFRIYLSGQNVFTLTDYPGFNPEVDDEETTLQTGKAWNEYAIPRTFTIGVNTSF